MTESANNGELKWISSTFSMFSFTLKPLKYINHTNCLILISYRLVPLHYDLFFTTALNGMSKTTSRKLIKISAMLRSKQLRAFAKYRDFIRMTNYILKLCDNVSKVMMIWVLIVTLGNNCM